ncbi:hypothetical protein ACOSP7_020401 [Xanthoceras sorbifolium]
MVLLFKTPLRKLMIMGIDRVKRGRGVYSMLKIQKRWIDDGVVNPTDQVLMAKHLLEATLMAAGSEEIKVLEGEFTTVKTNFQEKRKKK